MSNDRAQTVYATNSFSVDAIQVPGGMLYILAHYEWQIMNTVFVPEVLKQDLRSSGRLVNAEHVKEFIEGKR